MRLYPNRRAKGRDLRESSASIAKPASVTGILVPREGIKVGGLYCAQTSMRHDYHKQQWQVQCGIQSGVLTMTLSGIVDRGLWIMMLSLSGSKCTIDSVLGPFAWL
jgi:hypothetical protein